MHLRMSERELAAAKELAGGLGMTTSDLVRVLLQLPADAVSGGARLVVVDRTTAAKLSREMTRSAAAILADFATDVSESE